MNAAGDVTLLVYDGVNNLSTMTAPNGNVTTNRYDALDRMIEVDDRIGLVAKSTYDNVGNRLTQTDGNGNMTRYIYDAIDRPTIVTDPLLRTTVTKYDALGNILQVTDREGHITTNVYDKINRRTSSTDALSNATQYQYDGVGNVLIITDANGHATQYKYDDINRVIRETYADPPPSTRTFAYDAVNLISRTDQKNQTTTYVYNDLYFLLKRTYPVSAADRLTYDLSARMLTAERGGWLVTFAYDGANRVIQTMQNGKTIGYVYDIPGRTRTVTYPGGRSITERMDSRSRLSIIDDAVSPPPIVQYSYDLGNRVVTRAYRNGAIATYGYNANDWVTSLEHTIEATRIAGFGYDFDKEGNKKFEQKRHSTTNSEGYQYDNIYRLIDYKVGALVGSSVPVPITQTQYNLDPVGNWNSKTTDDVTQFRRHDEANELTRIDGTNLTYDDNGNLQDDATYTYSYDEENRLTRVTRNSDSAIVGQYQYDALSRRVQKIANPAGVPSTTRSFHDDARIIEEQDTVDVTQATYTYGNYIDEVLSMHRGAQTFYYHQNSLWSVEAITDAAGSVVERYAYDAYGLPAIFNGAGAAVAPNPWGTPRSAIGNPWMFTGRQDDEEMGLYFYRARYYDALKGRFLQRDSLEYVDGMNLYAYAGNDPIDQIDYLGLNPKAYDSDVSNNGSSAANHRLKIYKILTYAAVATVIANRDMTAEFLDHYLMGSGTEVTLNGLQMDKILGEPGFNDTVMQNIAKILQSAGPGYIDYKDSSYQHHVFDQFVEPVDLFSAFHGIDFRNALKGCVSGNITFEGDLTTEVFDNWNFSNPALGGRQPFATVPLLREYAPEIANITEEEFRQLELHGYVKPFDIKGTKTCKVCIEVKGGQPSVIKEELTY